MSFFCEGIPFYFLSNLKFQSNNYCIFFYMKLVVNILNLEKQMKPRYYNGENSFFLVISFNYQAHLISIHSIPIQCYCEISKNFCVNRIREFFHLRVYFQRIQSNLMKFSDETFIQGPIDYFVMHLHYIVPLYLQFV